MIIRLGWMDAVTEVRCILAERPEGRMYFFGFPYPAKTTHTFNPQNKYIFPKRIFLCCVFLDYDENVLQKDQYFLFFIVPLFRSN